jgi:phage shock protein PspC (stress-responsive transcriptional regulator)
MPFVILFTLCFFYLVFYLVYKLVVLAANAIVDSSMRKEVIDGEIAEKGAKFTFKIKDWFTWNVQTNNEKGTAGGNIKINFPVKSALALAVICFVLCAVCMIWPPTAFLVPAIFFLFALYYFQKWWRTLQVVKSVEDWYAHTSIPEFAKRQLARHAAKGMVGGVCAGLNEYTGVYTGIIRILFIATSFAGGLGIIIYGFLWFILPNRTI